MKIRVSTKGKSIAVDMEEVAADQMFTELAGVLLGFHIKTREDEGNTQPETLKEKEVQEMKSGQKEGEKDKNEAGEVYKGFLYIKCEACGKIKGFCTKGISGHTCTCGHVTPLKNLRPLHVNCQCGKSFKYLTNLEEEMFDIPCIECGNPVAVSWNPKKKLYQTIR